MVHHIGNIAASERHTIVIVLPEEKSGSAAPSLDKRVTGSCSREVNIGKGIVMCLRDLRCCQSQVCHACRGSIC